MEGLNYNAKIAVVKLLDEILKADKIVHEKEVKYKNEVIQLFNLNDNYQAEVNDLMTLQALAIIRELNSEQKGEIAKMMGRMIIVDEDINYNEVKLYNAFCESCGIEKDFSTDNYPEYSLSGPFINPEEMFMG